MMTKNNKIKTIIALLALSFTISAQNLKPGDGIKISFFNIEEEINGEYFIQDNGNIHLPYLGLLKTMNKDFSELRSDVIKGYTNIYKNPEISVQPLYRIGILGEVTNPGVYYVSGFETITDVLALAGGENSDSNIENIMILRNDSQMEIDLESFLVGNNNLSDIGIESGDKIFVPRTWWVGARDASILVSGVAVIVALAGLFTN